MSQSRIVATRALGKPLPTEAVVHHVNEDSSDNRPENLVICENNAYHKLLHLRLKAYEATGNARARRCEICKEWGVPGDGDMVVYKKTRHSSDSDGFARHKSCHNWGARRGIEWRLQNQEK